MHRSFLVLLVAGCTMHCAGQWDVPVKVVLDGTDGNDRQVIGLAEPASADAAVSLDALRTQYLYTVAVSGSEVLTGDPALPVEAYTPGLMVQVTPGEPHAAGASLDLNGLGPVPMLRNNGSPVLAGDLPVNTPTRLVFTGTAFQMLDGARLPCRPGYTAISSTFCMSDSAIAAGNFYFANRTCRNQGARLCSITEWMAGCLSIPGFLATVAGPEWVDHAANNNSEAKVIGFGSDGTPNNPQEFGCARGFSSDRYALRQARCCTTR